MDNLGKIGKKFRGDFGKFNEYSEKILLED